MKNKLITNLMAFLLAALVIAAGIIIPGVLLNRQEENIIGNKKTITVQEKQPVSVQGTNSPQVSLLYGDDLVNRISAWDSVDTDFIREPNNNEFSMEDAFSIAKNELQKLMDADAIPNINIQGYQLSNAQLKAKSEPAMARWELKLAYMEETAQVEMDAETGNIYSVIVEANLSNNITNTERLTNFAEYYRIEGKPAYIYMNKDDGTLEPLVMTEKTTGEFGRLIIFVSSTKSSAEESKYTIKFGLKK